MLRILIGCRISLGAAARKALAAFTKSVKTKPYQMYCTRAFVVLLHIYFRGGGKKKREKQTVEKYLVNILSTCQVQVRINEILVFDVILTT